MKGKFLKVIGYTIQDPKKASLRTKAVRWLVGFLVLVVLFTILSRAADNMTIAKVTVGQSEQKTIDHSVKIAGEIKYESETTVKGYNELVIDSIKVENRQVVEIGDVLYTVDMDDLDKKITDLQKEIAKLQESINISEYNAKLAKDKEARDYNNQLDVINDKKKEADKAVAKAEQRLKDAKEAEQQPPSTGEDGGEGTIPVPQAESELADAKEARDKDYKDAEKELTELNAPKELTQEDKTAYEDKATKEETLAKYVEVKNLNGEIKATTSGMINGISVEAGAPMTDGTIMRIATSSGTTKFTGQTEKDNEKYITKDSTITLKPSQGQEITNLKVTATRPNAENAEMIDVIIEIPEGLVELGVSAEIDIVKKSDIYSIVIPNEAIREESNSKYVLVAHEVETILGTEYVAQRVDVTVSEKNDEYSAIAQGSLMSDQEFIISSNKEIKEGDRVRLEE